MKTYSKTAVDFDVDFILGGVAFNVAGHRTAYRPEQDAGGEGALEGVEVTRGDGFTFDEADVKEMLDGDYDFFKALHYAIDTQAY